LIVDSSSHPTYDGIKFLGVSFAYPQKKMAEMRRSLACIGVILTICLMIAVPSQGSSESLDPCRLENANGQIINLGMTRSRLLLPSTGEVKILVIGVDFVNARERGTVEQMVAGFELKKVRDFFEVSSYGKLKLDFTIASEVVQLPVSDFSINEATIAREAAKALPSTIRLSEHSGLLIVTTKNSSYSSSTASAGHSVENASGRLTNYSVLAGIKPNERRWLDSPWLTITHEVGHLLGLMDLWNREDSTAWQGQTAAPFSVMNTGAGWNYAADLFAWEKWALGWIRDDEVRCITKGQGDIEIELVGLDNPNGTKLVVVPLTATTALAVEFRSKSVLDYGITRPGALVYLVDTAKRNFEVPIRLVASEESLMQPLSVSLRDFERFKKAPLASFESVESFGLQIANLGLEGRNLVLISGKPRADVIQRLKDLELQRNRAKEEASKAAAPAKPTPVKVIKYANCKAMQAVHKGGVAKSSTVKNKGATSKFKPLVNSKLYALNRGLDRDKDGIACER